MLLFILTEILGYLLEFTMVPKNHHQKRFGLIDGVVNNPYIKKAICPRKFQTVNGL